MNTKHYLIISGIVGGVIGSLFTALLVSPVTAQRDKFGEIECRSFDGLGAPMAMGSDEHGGVLLTTELFEMANARWQLPWRGLRVGTLASLTKTVNRRCRV